MDLSGTSDENLMSRFRKRADEAALQELFDRHGRSAMRFARRILGGDLMAAEDAVQQAFLRLIRNRKTYAVGRSFRAWFYTILRHCCHDIQRRRGREMEKLERYAADSAAEEPSTPRRGVADLMNLLQPADREILELRFAQRFSFADIADVLGCTEDAARKRGQRALKRLRDALREEEATIEFLVDDAPVCPDHRAKKSTKRQIRASGCGYDTRWLRTVRN